jgi:hypothetical protein
MNISLRLESLQGPINEAEYSRAFDVMQRDHVDGVVVFPGERSRANREGAFCVSALQESAVIS